VIEDKATILSGERANLRIQVKGSLIEVKVSLPEKIWIEVIAFSIALSEDHPLVGIKYERMCIRNTLRSIFYLSRDDFSFTDFKTLNISLNNRSPESIINDINLLFREYEGIETADEKKARLEREYIKKQKNKTLKVYREREKKQIRKKYLDQMILNIRKNKTISAKQLCELISVDQLSKDQKNIFREIENCLKEIFQNISGVYKILNVKNGGFYIGESGSKMGNIATRWTYHIINLLEKAHSNGRLLSEYLDYGLNSFNFQILEECEPSITEQRERSYILEMKPHYNFLLEGSKESNDMVFVPWGFSRWEELKNTF
jgi:hypothetical protein